MANKLAGQRAKLSRARVIFYSPSDDPQRQRAAKLMAEVLADAPRMNRETVCGWLR
jgi:hypothetical protein